MILFRTYLCMALSMFIVGSNIALGKLVVQEVPVFLFAGLRFLIASVILLPLMLQTRLHQVFCKKTFGLLFWQSFVGCFLFSLFILYGVQRTSVINAGIITSTLPSVIALIAWFWLREHLTGKVLIALMLVMLGIVLLHLPAGGSHGSNSFLGNMMVMGAIFSEGFFVVIGRLVSQFLAPWAITIALNLFSLLFFLPVALPQALSFHWSDISWSVWSILIYYAITSSILSFLLWYKGVVHVPAHTAGLFTGLVPVGATVAGIFLLNEKLDAMDIVGMLLVLAAIWIGCRPEQKKTETVLSELKR
ncbi:MAG: DMT family transporter [Enterobacteriaceae bacterium]